MDQTSEIHELVREMARPPYGESADDKENPFPASFLGRTMTAHGEDFQSDSEFGNCLIALGHANERVAAIKRRLSPRPRRRGSRRSIDRWP